MRRPKRSTWFVFAVFLLALGICTASGAFPSRERQLDEAIEKSDANRILRLLRSNLDPNTEVCAGYTTPDWAARFPFSLLPFSFAPQVCAQKSPLIVEVARSVYEPDAQIIVAELLRRGVAVNSQNSDNETALYEAVTRDDVDMARFLLDQGANPNVNQIKNGLFYASQSNNLPMVRLLLARGANPNVAHVAGRTSLMAAAGSGGLQTMDLLLHYGADVNAQDADGKTALSHSLSWNWRNGNKREIQMLLRHGASLFIKDKTGQTPFDYLPFAHDFYNVTGQSAKIPYSMPGPSPP